MEWRRFTRSICRLDRKFAWSFTGVVLALLFGAMAIYGQFFSDLNPHLRYEILANAPVIDVREDITKLSVLFDGMDIRKQKESLRVMTIRIVNDSDRDILKGYYDQNDPLGLSISGGKIIRADLLSASNAYLEKQVTPRQSTDTALSFPDVILEARESFIIKLLLLHPESAKLEIHPTGKIAGIQSVPVSEPYRQEPTPSFFQRAFVGGTFIQCFRVISYGVLMIVVLISFAVACFVVGEKVRPWLATRPAKKLLKEFKQQANMAILPGEELVLHDILVDWNDCHKRYLPPLLSLISDSNALESNYMLAMQELKEAKAKEETEAAQKRLEEERRDRVRCEDPRRLPAEGLARLLRYLIPYYLEKGLIMETAKGPALNKHMMDAVGAFTEFLRKRDCLGKSSDAATGRENCVAEHTQGKNVDT